jgi:hypothetical protein
MDETAIVPSAEAQPMVSLKTACRALDIGLTKGYELANKGEFPVTCKRVGGLWKVKTRELREYTGLDREPEYTGLDREPEYTGIAT